MGISSLREDGCPWAEGRAENMMVLQDIIIRWLSCKGENKVSRELRAPSTAEKVKRECSSAWAGLAEASLKGADK